MTSFSHRSALLLATVSAGVCLSSCGSDSNSDSMNLPNQTDRAFPPIKAPVEIDTMTEEEEESTVSVGHYSDVSLNSVNVRQKRDQDQKTKMKKDTPGTLSFEDRVRISSDPTAAATKAAEMIEALANEMRDHFQHIQGYEMAVRAKAAMEKLEINRDAIKELTRDLDKEDEDIAKILSDAKALLNEVVESIHNDPNHSTLLAPTADRLSDL